MSEGIPDLPPDVAAQLDVNEDYRVQDHHIVAEFVDSDRAFLTVGHLSRRLEMSAQGVRDRLDRLEGMGVLDSRPAANGRIYWLRDERSEWPIPPDVHVEPIPDEPTLSEVLGRRDVQLTIAGGLVGVVAVLALMALILVGVYGLGPAALEFPLALVSVVGGIGCVGLLAGAVLAWVLRVAAS